MYRFMAFYLIDSNLKRAYYLRPDDDERELPPELLPELLEDDPLLLRLTPLLLEPTELLELPDEYAPELRELLLLGTEPLL